MLVTQITSSLRESDGGPFYSVPSLSAALARQGCDVTLRTVDERTPDWPHNVDRIATAHYRASGPLSGVLRTSSALNAALRKDALRGSILHAHGLWLAPNLYPAAIRKKNADARFVCSPRGMLGTAALRFSRWKKRLAWETLQKSALARADCLHATARSEHDEIRARGLLVPIAVIPNGIDIPDLTGFPQSTGPRQLLALGRLHPKKGLDQLLHAWARLESEHKEWQLIIVGPSERGYDHQLRALVAQLGLVRAQILDAAYGESKLSLLRASDVLVLPTLNENFGVVVAEALAAEVPVISTKGAPWSGLEREKCGWWIDHGIDALEASLRLAMSLERNALQGMGRNGRAWMRRDYSWDRVGEDMLAVYRWLSFDGPEPRVVHRL